MKHKQANKRKSKKPNILTTDLSLFPIEIDKSCIKDRKIHIHQTTERCTCIGGGGGKPSLKLKSWEKPIKIELQQLDMSHLTGSIVIHLTNPSTTYEAKRQAKRKLLQIKNICTQQGFEFTIIDEKIKSLTKQRKMLYSHKKNTIVEIETSITLEKNKLL